MTDGLCSVSYFKYYFEYILKKHETVTVNPSITIYVNKIENRNTFKIKIRYYLELLTHATIKLLGSTTSKINRNENSKNVFHLEVTEALLIHCNIGNSDDEQDLRALYTFVCNKLFSQLLDISPKSFIFLKTFNSEFSNTEVCFTDQHSKPLGIED